MVRDALEGDRMIGMVPLATSLLIEDKPIAEYEFQRQELIGIRKLLAYIDNDIRVLEDEHEKNTGTS